MMSRIKK